MTELKVLGLIPARAGSKGVPNKNIKPLVGKPLIGWTIDCAKQARGLASLVVSTDSEEIATVALAMGAEVPFMRPAELADDNAGSLGVVIHCLSALADHGQDFDAVMLLQPTTPFRDASDIDRAIEILETTDTDSVVSMVPIPIEDHPHWAYLENPDGSVVLASGQTQPTTRRQDLPPALRREGSIYLTRTHIVLKGGSLYGDKVTALVLDPDKCLDINTAHDWQMAERFATNLG